MKTHVIWIALCTAVVGVPQEAPVIPAEVGERLELAVSPEDDEGFVGSYTLASHSVIQKPNGKARHELELVMEVTRSADGELERRVVRAIRDGEDRTEQFREDMRERESEERGERDSDEQGDEDGMEMEPRLPFGEDAALYEISRPRQENELTVVEFAPNAAGRKEERMVEGAMAWVTASLDPAWVDATALDPEKPLRDFWLRMEFERAGDRLIPSRIHTRGLARVLLFKREFDVEVRISDVRPE